MTHPESGSGTLDLSEKGAPVDGVPQRLDQRLYMQLLVVSSGDRSADLGLRIGEELSADGAGVVVYEDACDPLSFGILTYTTDPTLLLTRVRPALRKESLGDYTVRHDMTMIGRTYSTGYEQNLPYWLLERPVETVQNEAWPWAIWYPLRRSGAFEQLEAREKGAILREHGEIGKEFGASDLAHDVRLACHGLDAKDNEFLIGLIGKDLAPLSQVVQRMRSTRQTSEFIVQMGPFFVGRAIYRAAWTR